MKRLWLPPRPRRSICGGGRGRALRWRRRTASRERASRSTASRPLHLHHLIDCSPSLGYTTLNILTAADTVLRSPCSADTSPLEGPPRSCWPRSRKVKGGLSQGSRSGIPAHDVHAQPTEQPEGSPRYADSSASWPTTRSSSTQHPSRARPSRGSR